MDIKGFIGREVRAGGRFGVLLEVKADPVFSDIELGYVEFTTRESGRVDREWFDVLDIDTLQHGG